MLLCRALLPAPLPPTPQAPPPQVLTFLRQCTLCHEALPGPLKSHHCAQQANTTTPARAQVAFAPSGAALRKYTERLEQCLSCKEVVKKKSQHGGCGKGRVLVGFSCKICEEVFKQEKDVAEHLVGHLEGDHNQVAEGKDLKDVDV
eukprot:TRINITY_DN20580_c0_g2_i3.p1 TRINITY_DN20580_c0_g2~~TRINITY_DN20580_c0_g2_i3.p1  ORF type:complete len:146 (-),score=40.48 TRINITY_DN20580_c0_g2_i3:1248-1685(-)